MSVCAGELLLMNGILKYFLSLHLYPLHGSVMFQKIDLQIIWRSFLKLKHIETLTEISIRHE